MVIQILILFIKLKLLFLDVLTTALTPICMYLIAVTNLLAYWFGFMGVYSWSITIILLILGVYFTKNMPISDK